MHNERAYGCLMNVDRLDCVEGRLRTQVLSVRAIQLVERWCANGGPNRGTLLEARHRLPERHYAGTESDNPAHAPCQNLGQSEPLFGVLFPGPFYSTLNQRT